MARFAVQTGACVLCVSALTALATPAAAQRGHGGGFAGAGHGMGFMGRGGGSFMGRGAGAFGQFHPQHLSPQFAAPRGAMMQGQHFAAPGGALRRFAPGSVVGGGVRAVGAVEPPRQAGGNVGLPSLEQRGVVGPASTLAGRSSLPVMIRETTGGATLTGLPPPANRTAVVRGPFLRNPAFFQPAARNDAAPALARTTFSGRFADHQRLRRRVVVIGWVGPLFWPYAYGDLIDYTFWPHAYDSFWPRAYDDVYQGMLGPYAVGAEPGVAAPALPAAASPATAPPPAEQLPAVDLAQVCGRRVAALTAWPIEQIARVVEPDDAQRAALFELADAAERAVELMRSGCPTELPGTPTGRLAAVRSRLEVMLQAVAIVRPAIDKFYGSLNDEQKARFNAIDPGALAAEAARSADLQGGDLAQACRGEVASLSELPIALITETVHPSPAQQSALDALNAASMAAAELLKANCTENRMLTPPSRLAAMAQRLAAILQAAKTVQPALEGFYNSLDDAQKARLNLLGTQPG